MIVFDGVQFAAEREQALAPQVAELGAAGTKITIAAVLFTEDKGSQLYTGLKKQAAERVGMTYHIASFSLEDPLEDVISEIHTLNEDPAITGIIIQKPSKKTWTETFGEEASYQDWWNRLVTAIDPQKDVDGLHPETLAAIQDGSWQSKGKVMPATAKAVLSILENAQQLKHGKYLILGKSEILGRPLAYELHNRGFEIEMMGKRELTARLQNGLMLKDGDVVISATGQSKLVTGVMLKDGAVVVDVGEPRPDIDRESVEAVASFLTPVPGGVGPVTVVSLLENALHLAKQHGEM
jgi:methylenetetrahydrofolate dehydrogenase (NADP+)/methenyltetrahydrofolate cyclohydrolase